MRFAPFPLVEWLKDAEGVRYDLANSSAPPMGPTDLGGVPLGYANTWGFPELRRAVADAYDVEDGEIAITGGTQEACFLTLLSILKPGDRVAAETPSYPPIFQTPAGVGAEVVPLRRRHADGFQIDANEADDALKGGAKALIVTNPHNPSGVPLRNLDELCAVAERRKAYIIVDEVYRELMARPAKVARCVSDRAITVSGVAKAYGLGGARVGWALAPKSVAKQIRLAKDHTTVSNSTHGEALAIAALRNRKSILRRNRALVGRNMSLAKRFVDSHDWLRWVEPEANMGFPRLPKGVKSVEFCRRALRRGLLLAPGKYFGLEGHFRMTFCCRESEMRDGLRALGEVA